MPLLRLVAVCLLLLPALAAAAEPKPDSLPEGPLSPAEAMKQFELAPGLKLELVAAEPDVVDPVAVVFDEDGRMWVVEMRDYPLGPADGQPPQSRIRILEDLDGDGRFETARTFAENLLFVTGVQPWKGGVIVTMAGEVAYFKDTDNDGKADQRETWFTGFVQENSQLRANHPTFGLDNHIYVANGLRGGTVVAKKKGWSEQAKPVSISGMDFRFDPLTGSYEAVSGNGQFGLTFDDFGNRFVCSNRNPCKHIVLQDRYIKRNPFLAVTSVLEDVSPAAELSRVYSITKAWTTSTLHAGQFTAACGVTIYRGDALPAEFRGNSFTCEPTGSLVHRDVIDPAGATFKARPYWEAKDPKEFLASRDSWFRPVNLANGPDGALYVVDMYRAVIEHPQFMPTELRNRPDLRYGDDRGRIWRVVPASGQKVHRDAPRLSRLSTSELVAQLKSANSWHRETAQRLLVERQDTAAVAELEALVADTKLADATRVHALWTLKGLGKLDAKTLVPLLDEAQDHPRVCEQALRLLEPFVRTPEGTQQLAGDRGIEKLLATPAKADDVRLRFQLALLLGEFGEEERQKEWIATRLAEIATADSSDDWTLTAALSSASLRPDLVLKEALREPQESARWHSQQTRDALRRIAELIGSQQTYAADALKRLALEPKTDAEFRTRMSALQGLAQGLRRRGKPLASVLAGQSEVTQAAVEGMANRAAQTAASAEADTALRTEAIEFLKYAQFPQGTDTLLEMASSEPLQPLRLAAIDALALRGDKRIGEALLEDYAQQTPAVRRTILDAMLANTDRTALLLSAIEEGTLERREIDAARAQRLMKHRTPALREKARKLLAVSIDPDRQKVIEQYRVALTLEADPLRGREIFAKTCVTCHRIGDLGVNVAPDIADSRTKTPEQLLTDILDPNRAVDNNYFSYTVLTTEGQVLTGIIASETASSITLRQPEDKTLTVLREEIEELKSNGVSLMPTGLEKDITPQQMADLVSFIKNWRYLDGSVPVGGGE